MAHDQSPLPAVISAVLLGPSGLGTSAARMFQATGTGDAGTAVGDDEVAQLAASAPAETVRSVAAALIAASLTDDPAVADSLPEVLNRIQDELRRLTRTASTCG
jgi:hypothetical protein